MANCGAYSAEVGSGACDVAAASMHNALHALDHHDTVENCNQTHHCIQTHHCLRRSGGVEADCSALKAERGKCRDQERSMSGGGSQEVAPVAVVSWGRLGRDVAAAYWDVSETVLVRTVH